MSPAKGSIALLAALFLTGAFSEVALADDVTDFEMVEASSAMLPDGLKLEISHKRDWEVSDLNSQADYKFLSYSFSKNGKNIGTARVYMHTVFEAAFHAEKDVSLESEDVQACLKTLLVLGFDEIEILSEDGYKTVDLNALGITQGDVLAWARAMDRKVLN